MINLNSQRREFNIVISDITLCDYHFDDFYTWLNNSGFRYYLITHDKDVDENGEPIRPHMHLVLSGVKRWRVKQLLNDLVDCLWTLPQNIQIEEVKNFTACVQYLIHKNDVNKYQYDYKLIKTNDNDNLVPLLNETIVENKITTDKLIDLIISENVGRLELIKILGIGTYQHFKSVINELYAIKNGQV